MKKSDKEKLFSRRKAFHEGRRTLLAKPGFMPIPPEEMTPFVRYMHDNYIAPAAKRDWGLVEIADASAEVLQLQAFHRQATSAEAKAKIARKLRDIVCIKDSPEVSYLVHFFVKETDPDRRARIEAQMRGGPVVIPVPENPVAALHALIKAELENE